MCGIFGGTITESETRKGINRLLRGNDGISIYEFKDSRITFGFKRHAVIAPRDAYSMQPIISKDSETALVMNGEIFDYATIKKDLQSNGVSFSSKGDAEVILHLYRQLGNSFCEKTDSMFAGALYDTSKEYPRIVLFRDWVGEEPLHYIYNREKKLFVFSSEIKGFLDFEWYSLENVKELDPGSILEVNLADFTLQQQKYVNFNIQKPITYEDELAVVGKELRIRLEKAAAERIISDVPICCLVSGGIDSTVTTYLVNEILKKEGKKPALYTFHIAGEPIVEGVDLFHARIVAKHFGLEEQLREVHINQDDIIKALPDVLYSLEDKRVKDFNVYPAIYNYFLARRISRDGYKVAFNGEGSDELFGSYGSWGSFTVGDDEITKNEFRLKMVQNLHKGVLARTSKVMMYAGPVEMRTFFLSKNVADYILSIPPKLLRSGAVWKMPLVCAFEDVIPQELLMRPKARPQVSTGIMGITSLIRSEYSHLGETDDEIFEKIFNEKFRSYFLK